jgi:hypothetical protein
MRSGLTRRDLRAMAGLALVAVTAAACERPPAKPIPDAGTVAGYYSYEGELEARISGNVAEVVATQPAVQLERGGSLWARVGPYFFLFTEATYQLLEDYPGLAGVRVVTRVEGGGEAARALLLRSSLTGVQWRRALNIAGHARVEGTDRPGLLEQLVRWGEDHTEFTYSPRYVPGS